MKKLTLIEAAGGKKIENILKDSRQGAKVYILDEISKKDKSMELIISRLELGIEKQLKIWMKEIGGEHSKNKHSDDFITINLTF